MDGVIREVNVMVFGKGLELLSANGGRFELNQLLFVDVNVGKSKVMRCSRYGNGDRMHVILKGEQLEEVDR